jgi:hypothetical protein
VDCAVYNACILAIREKDICAMADSRENKIIKPPTSIKSKVGIGGPGAADLAAIERAEQATANLAGDYLEWVQEDLEKIQNAANALIVAKDDDAASGLNDVFQISHDMKGQGGSFGYQLMTSIGDMLCGLVEGRQEAPPDLIEAIQVHIATMKLVIAERMEGDGGMEGRTLLKGLAQVAIKIRNASPVST